MTPEEKNALAERIRIAAKQLRKEGYTYKPLYSAIKYKPMDWYNFMRGYQMSEDNLVTLANLLETRFAAELK